MQLEGRNFQEERDWRLNESPMTNDSVNYSYVISFIKSQKAEREILGLGTCMGRGMEGVVCLERAWKLHPFPHLSP